MKSDFWKWCGSQCGAEKQTPAHGQGRVSDEFTWWLAATPKSAVRVISSEASLVFVLMQKEVKGLVMVGPSFHAGKFSKGALPSSLL